MQENGIPAANESVGPGSQDTSEIAPAGTRETPPILLIPAVDSAANRAAIRCSIAV
jgi:hypothetical protein